ncbi:cytochrome c-type biogenesis protein CcmH [uncultured Ilumatobacter sp.]|uniref:cytochrome c-type biogenesis protein n=1 Tax=uncultured Ilumatobacter sp. TaxID=879968 RepID=UPI00374F82C7
MSSGLSEINNKMKGWPGWVLLLVVVVSVLAIGSTRASGPQSQEERIDLISKRVACPVCNGESVAESRNNASRAIRNEIDSLVRSTPLTDDQIVAGLEDSYGTDILLVPRATGFDALIWVLPTMAFVFGVAGLAVAFRRWRVEADGMADPTDADRDIVAAARRADRP